jgi:hypothetical protein
VFATSKLRKGDLVISINGQVVANPSVAANVVKHTKMDTFEIIFIAMEALQELALRDAAEKHEQKATIKRTEHQNTWKMGFPNWRRGLEILKFERDIDGNVACVNAEPWLHLKSENNFGTINAASFHTGRVLYSDHYTHKVLPMPWRGLTILWKRA